MTRKKWHWVYQLWCGLKAPLQAFQWTTLPLNAKVLCGQTSRKKFRRQQVVREKKGYREVSSKPQGNRSVWRSVVSQERLNAQWETKPCLLWDYSQDKALFGWYRQQSERTKRKKKKITRELDHKNTPPKRKAAQIKIFKSRIISSSTAQSTWPDRYFFSQSSQDLGTIVSILSYAQFASWVCNLH